MKRLITSDWQLSPNMRDRYRFEWAWGDLFRLIDKHKPNQLLMLGDLTEEKDKHPARLVNEVVALFTKLVRKCEIVILQGNHDFEQKEYPFFQFLTEIDRCRIHWISAPTVKENCLYLPHTRNHKDDWKGVKFDGYDFIFAHNIFTGATGNGQKLSGIPISVFPDDGCVISGDVHEPQQFDLVCYVGSPYTCDFGDNFIPRCLVSDGVNLKSVKTKGPQKRLVEIDWNNYDMPAIKANPGDIIKVKVFLRKEDTAHYAGIRDEIVNWAASEDFVLYTVQPTVILEQGARAAITNKGKTDEEHFDDFVKRNGVDRPTAKVGKGFIE